MRSFFIRIKEKAKKNLALTIVITFIFGGILIGGLVYLTVSGRFSNFGNNIRSYYAELGDKVMSRLGREIPGLNINRENSNDGFLKESRESKIYEPADEHERKLIEAIDSTSGSVVSISISKDVPIMKTCQVNPFGNFGIDNGWTLNVPCDSGKTSREKIGGGTGFVVSSDGLILTNKHVVGEKNGFYTVFLNDDRKFDAKVVATDDYQDIALLKIDTTGLVPLSLGDSDKVRLGQTVITIGNALGEFQNTVSVGIISGKGRNVTAADQMTGQLENIDSVFQTDASINSGNSGGPLINLRGEVIGINTAIVEGAQNVGFAVPINRARRAIESYRMGGKISTAFLGVNYTKGNDGCIVKADAAYPNGVIKDSPADKAGLKAGDIIIEADGKSLKNGDNSLSSVIAEHYPGDTIRLKVKRGEEILDISATLSERK